MASEDSASASASEHRVTVKVPTFMPSDPELWFCMLESSFDCAGVSSDEIKFGYVLSGLDERYAREVRDIIVKPKEDRTYNVLKSELIKRLGVSQEQNTRKLLENEQIGDRKPSQFLRHLRGLAGTNFPDEILQTLWLSRLPKHMQAVLVSHRDLSLEKRADIADSIAETFASETVAETTNTTKNLVAKVELIECALTKALEEIAALKVREPERRRRRYSRSRSRTPSRTYGGDDMNDMCWYHHTFGRDATKCRSPCRYASSGNATGNR